MVAVARGIRLPVVVAAVLAVVAGLVMVSAVPAFGGGAAVERTDGSNRYDTAARVALSTFASADTALLATGQSYPDALAASYAAGAGDHPILLAQQDHVPGVTAHAFDELDVERVILIGGEQAVGASVQQQLEDDGYEVHRVNGAERYATAQSVAMAWGADGGPVGTLEGDRTALLASGEGFADALAAGPVAAGERFPLLLTPSQHHPDRAASIHLTLQQLGIERVVVVGGTAAVDGDVVDYYENQGYDVERWAGATRDGTAAAVADHARTRLGFQPTVAPLARGDAFPDALAASIHGGKMRSPVLLTATPDTLGQQTRSWLADAAEDITVVRALGGSTAVSDAVLEEAAGAAGDADGFSRQERANERYPQAQGAAQLTDVRAAAHPDHDRVVLEVPGEPIGWEVTWADEPRKQPANEPVDVDGDAYLEVRATAYGQWADQGDYDGPDRIRIDGGIATEAVMTEDYKGMTTWVVGLEHEAPFAVDTLQQPQRLVIDIAAD